jgi:hypothetical protein
MHELSVRFTRLNGLSIYVMYYKEPAPLRLHSLQSIIYIINNVGILCRFTPPLNERFKGT